MSGNVDPIAGFETTQRDPFEAVGLDVQSRFIDLENPRVRTGVEPIPDARLESLACGHVPFFAHSERCALLIRELRDTGTTDGE